jgi:amino acid permease
MIPDAVEEPKVGVGAKQLFSLAMGAILGAGRIIGVGQWLVAAGPLGSILGFIGGAVVLSLIAASYAELAGRRPARRAPVSCCCLWWRPLLLSNWRSSH